MSHLTAAVGIITSRKLIVYMSNSYTSYCWTRLQDIIYSWPHKMRNYSGQNRGSNKRGILYPLMAPACGGEILHSLAAKHSVYVCVCVLAHPRVFPVCPSDQSSLTSWRTVPPPLCEWKVPQRCFKRIIYLYTTNV